MQADKLTPRALEALERLEAQLGADPAERSEQSLGWRLDNALTYGRRCAATDRNVRARLEAFERALADKPEPAPAKPSRAQLAALRALEVALGWKARKLSAPATLEDFRERTSTARSSAGLGLMIAPDFQAESIRKALARLKSAKPSSR